MIVRFRTIIMVIAITVCVTIDPMTHNTVSAQSNGEDEPVPIHIVTGTHADARVRRDGWTGFSGLSLGASLQFGDLVDPGGEPVQVLCTDLTEHTVAQLDAVPCSPQGRTVLVQEGQSLAAWQRGAREDVMIPFLITPRTTVVLTPQPLFQWNPVLGADGYRIFARGEGLNWSGEVTDPGVYQLLYPADAPLLVPGVSYSVEIVSIASGNEGRSSTEEDALESSFVVMAPDEAEAIQTTTVDIHASVDDESIATIVGARYYAQNGLFAEALQALLPISGDLLVSDCPSGSSVSESPVVYLMLGDLYLQTQIELYAAIAYTCAFDLAHRAEDLESQALAATALARLAMDEEERSEYMVSALGFWEQLGADAQIEALREEFASQEETEQ